MPQNRPSDQEIYERLLDLTLSGTLDWKQVYEEDKGPEPKEDLAWSTAPHGYYAEDPYHGFGRVAIKPEDEKDDIEHPVLYISGERMEVSSEDVNILVDAIEKYIDEVRSGKNPSTAERINREIERNLEPMKEQVASMEHQLALREEEVGDLLKCLRNVTASAGSEERPPLTAENVIQVIENIDYEVDSDDNVRIQPESVESAIEQSELVG